MAKPLNSEIIANSMQCQLLGYQTALLLEKLEPDTNPISLEGNYKYSTRLFVFQNDKQKRPSFSLAHYEKDEHCDAFLTFSINLEMGSVEDDSFQNIKSLDQFNNHTDILSYLPDSIRDKITSDHFSEIHDDGEDEDENDTLYVEAVGITWEDTGILAFFALHIKNDPGQSITMSDAFHAHCLASEKVGKEWYENLPAELYALPPGFDGKGPKKPTSEPKLNND